jgi:hypothetical protein
MRMKSKGEIVGSIPRPVASWVCYRKDLLHKKIRRKGGIVSHFPTLKL